VSDIDWDVRARLQSYLLGQESLRDFQRWFMPVVWTVSDRGDPPKLMRAVELWLAEYTNGHRTEPELRSLFAGVLTGLFAGPVRTFTTVKSTAESWTAPSIEMTLGEAGATTTT
jgi:hypothetical protein